MHEKENGKEKCTVFKWKKCKNEKRCTVFKWEKSKLKEKMHVIHIALFERN